MQRRKHQGLEKSAAVRDALLNRSQKNSMEMVLETAERVRRFEDKSAASAGQHAKKNEAFPVEIEAEPGRKTKRFFFF